MPKISAGLLIFRRKDNDLEILLVHPGGPFWAKKDMGTWSIPKGLVNQGEALFAAAAREFNEETGAPHPSGEAYDLGYVKYGNKQVFIWAIEGDFNVHTIKSETVMLEWPPKSGVYQSFPECDKADWFVTQDARQKIVKGQLPLVDRLIERVR